MGLRMLVSGWLGRAACVQARGRVVCLEQVALRQGRACAADVKRGLPQLVQADECGGRGELRGVWRAMGWQSTR